MAEYDVLGAIYASHQERVGEIDARYKRSQWRMTLVFVLFLVGLVALDWFASLLPNPPGPSVVAIYDLTAEGPTELCPGDALSYSYVVDGGARGVLDLDVSLWRSTPPPQTIIYSDSLRVILVEPIRHERHDSWVVPGEVTDPLTQQTVQITPGDYERRVAISTPSRNTNPAIAVLPFRIIEGCE